jgi:hypothetical protein
MLTLHIDQFGLMLEYVTSLSLFVSMAWENVSELRPSTGLLFVSQMMYEYWESRWSDIGQNNEDLEVPVSVSLCPPQIPHGMNRERTRVSAVRDRRQTA